MAVDFETPTAALFTRLTGLAGINYATRILEDWDSSAPAKQPALMLTSAPINELAPNTQLQGVITPLWRMELLVVLYVQTPDPKVPPSTILNPLIAAVCNAFLKQAGETTAAGAKFPPNVPGQFLTTLGGLCSYARPFGKIERAEGLAGHVSVAHIPIELVVSS